MKIKLKKSRSSIEINIPDNKVFEIILGKNVSKISHDSIKKIIYNGIKANTPKNIKDKKTAIIIPDDTRLWARGDIFVPQIVKALFDCGALKDNIKIIIALGTHNDMSKDKFIELAGDYCQKKIEILNSANKNFDRLVHIGKTHKNTELYITKEAAQADHIIIFGGILHHLTAGFGGGRKYILPGIAGYDSILQNHCLAIRNDGTPHPLVQQAQLSKNPINEDMNDAARLFLKNKTCTYSAVAANGTGDIFHADTGPLHKTFMEGCKKLDKACCVNVQKKGDFALISAGGYRTDQQLYQSTKALFNAVNIVKKGGKILFVAGCSKGVGNEIFSSVLKKFRNDPNRIGKELVHNFNMPAYVAFRAIDVLSRFDITLVSDLDESLTRDSGFNYTNDIEKYINDLRGKGYIIPFAENILPVINTS